jgi:hypothetical protein
MNVKTVTSVPLILSFLNQIYRTVKLISDLNSIHDILIISSAHHNLGHDENT